MRLLLLAIACALTVSACPAPTEHDLPLHQVQLRILKAHVWRVSNETIAPASVDTDHDIGFVLLPSNPSTGYTWMPKETPALQYVGCQFRPSNSNRIGASGYDVFLFHATNDTGLVDLAFDYVRPWEVPLQPAQTRTIQVDVVRGAQAPETP
jgi:predicted secreted protein